MESTERKEIIAKLVLAESKIMVNVYNGLHKIVDILRKNDACTLVRHVNWNSTPDSLATSIISYLKHNNDYSTMVELLEAALEFEDSETVGDMIVRAILLF